MKIRWRRDDGDFTTFPSMALIVLVVDVVAFLISDNVIQLPVLIGTFLSWWTTFIVANLIVARLSWDLRPVQMAKARESAKGLAQKRRDRRVRARDRDRAWRQVWTEDDLS